jgi:very-short-patch-repair endonuclease
VAAKERTERARELRLTDSRAEQEVWELLRAHRMSGLKFRRQHPIGPYFADFACAARKLVVEVDGEHHVLQREADSRRTDYMEQADGGLFASVRARLYRTQKVSGLKSFASSASRYDPPLLASPPAARAERDMRSDVVTVRPGCMASSAMVESLWIRASRRVALWAMARESTRVRRGRMVEPLPLIGGRRAMVQGVAHDDARLVSEPPRAPGTGLLPVESNRGGSPGNLD